MFRKILKNDRKNDVFQTLNIFFFLLLSAAFLSTGAQMSVELSESVSRLLDRAKTPHLLQMHMGELDLPRLERFAASQPNVEDMQVLEFLNVENGDLALNGESLRDSVFDNGFSVQSNRFDFLLDLEGNFIDPNPGEVYVPLFYRTSGRAKEGDVLTFSDLSLQVAGFVRDSQMNSPLSVSKRFIVSAEDYEKIRPSGTPEYLIEFRMHEIQKSSEVETAYRENGLESNGPPFLTAPLFRLINAFSDGITIVTLLLISLLVIGIALLCVRFSLLAKLEEDRRELAVLKAIGLPIREIRRLFLAKVTGIAMIALPLGTILSFFLKIPLLKNAELFFGESEASVWSVLAGILPSILLFFILRFSMNRLSGRLTKLTVTEAAEEGDGKPIRRIRGAESFTLTDLLARKKAYLSMTFVFVLCVFLMNLPLSLFSTVSDRDFVNYLGVGSYDILIDFARVDEDRVETLLRALNEDPSVQSFALLQNAWTNTVEENGSTKKIWTEFGEHEAFPIRYLNGHAPEREKEIALSKLASEELSKKVGDSLLVQTENRSETLTVSGIYSDLTNGGKTAKRRGNVNPEEVVAGTIPVRLQKGVFAEQFLKKVRESAPFAKASDTETYLEQLFGNTISTIGTVTRIAFVAATLLVFLIVSLFTRLLFLRDQSRNALLRAVGFTNRDLRRQYIAKSVLVLCLGLLLGNLITFTIGDRLGSGILSLIGVHGIQFVRAPFLSLVAIPLALLGSAVLATRFGVSGLKKMNLALLLKEEV